MFEIFLLESNKSEQNNRVEKQAEKELKSRGKIYFAKYDEHNADNHYNHEFF